jgi:hypothetical protein
VRRTRMYVHFVTVCLFNAPYLDGKWSTWPISRVSLHVLTYSAEVLRCNRFYTEVAAGFEANGGQMGAESCIRDKGRSHCVKLSHRARLR